MSPTSIKIKRLPIGKGGLNEVIQNGGIEFRVSGHGECSAEPAEHRRDFIG